MKSIHRTALDIAQQLLAESLPVKKVGMLPSSKIVRMVIYADYGPAEAWHREVFADLRNDHTIDPIECRVVWADYILALRPEVLKPTPDTGHRIDVLVRPAESVPPFWESRASEEERHKFDFPSSLDMKEIHIYDMAKERLVRLNA